MALIFRVVTQKSEPDVSGSDLLCLLLISLIQHSSCCDEIMVSHGCDFHGLTRSWRMDHISSTDVDAHMRDAACSEEHQISRLKIGIGHFGSGSSLGTGYSR